MYQQRRQNLVTIIQEKYKEQASGVVVLFSDFETERIRFRQESSFYYFTGVREPATACVIDLNEGTTKLYIPNYGIDRSTWLADPIKATSEDAQKWGVDAIEIHGQACQGYACHPFFSTAEYERLIQLLVTCSKQERKIFTLKPAFTGEYVQQRFLLQRLVKMFPEIDPALTDISPFVASMRRKKGEAELEHIYDAINITAEAQQLVAQNVEPGMSEAQLEGLINYTFITNNAQAAFPSIVASGINGTVLHYMSNNSTAQEGDCVVVDIGAEKNYYCADITRTFPVSGTFTARQKELYNLVLETQTYIAGIAAPGYWLSNKEQPEKSLNHLARAFLKERGYDQYFLHGIGHYLGLDVHDVGDYTQPLEVGDVITIEPGIYIRQEGIGIRIEDNYWIVADGAVCLSEHIPKEVDAVEQWMAETVQG